MELGVFTNEIVNDYLKATNKAPNTLSVSDYIQFRKLAKEEYENGLATITNVSVNEHKDTNKSFNDTFNQRVNSRPSLADNHGFNKSSKITEIHPKEEVSNLEEDVDEEEFDMLSLLRSVKG